MAKANHECAPTQTGSVICCPLEAVDIECRPPRGGAEWRGESGTGFGPRRRGFLFDLINGGGGRGGRAGR